jgi:hypothetical protein
MASTPTRNTALRLLAATFVFAVVTDSAFAGQTARSTGNGTYISVSGNDSSGCMWFWVYASRGGTTQAPETYLAYDVYNQCTSQWIASGNGRIANAAFKATGKRATLSVSPAAAAGFFAAGDTGSLTLTVTGDGLYSSEYSGHTKTEYAGHLYQSHGSWTSKSATATGTLLGIEVAAASASFGEGRDKTMEIERGSR